MRARGAIDRRRVSGLAGAMELGSAWGRIGLGAVLVGALVLGFVGCSSDSDPRPGSAATSSSAGGNSPVVAHDGLTIPAPVFGSATPEAISMARVVAPMLQMEQIHEGCVAAGLSGDATLLAALGSDPQESTRWADVVALYGRCVQQSTLAQQFAAGFANVPAPDGRQVTAEQVVCLRDGYAALPSEVVAALIRAGLNPDTPDATTRSDVSQLVNQCGVDPALIKPPGTN